MKSHVQTPRCILQQFSNQNGRFYYYDVKKDIIGTNGHPKSINTIEDYYSANGENYLSAKVETQLPGMIGYLQSCIQNAKDPGWRFSLSKKQEEAITFYLYSQISRNPKTIESIIQNSIFYQFLGRAAKECQFIHDFAAMGGIEILQANDYLHSFDMTFIVNRSSIQFVLPVSGLYCSTFNGATHLNIPISPEIAITCSKRTEEQCDNSLFCQCIYRIDDDLIAHELNFAAFRLQCSEGQGFVVSSDRKELESLKEKG